MNIKLSFLHYATNKAYPIYLFEHDFTGMIDLDDYIAPNTNTITTSILSETKYI